ncbi:MAG: HAMP domain-containing protein [Anaerolineales bacterium]|nr:HAMP domain-containing protein [Anaerolineales bacterium]
MDHNPIRAFQKRKVNISLPIKLLGSFAVVIIMSATVVAALSRQSATREFTRFINENLQDDPPEYMIVDLANYFSEQGDWAGVEQVLGQIMIADEENEADFPMLLVDDQGNVVATNWMHLSNNQFPEQEMSLGWPIQVNGEIVGTLISPGRVPGPPPLQPDGLGPQEEAIIQRVQQAILISGLSAGVAALIIAGGLTWGLVRPLKKLTAAAEGIARGDLSQRVSVASSDEVGELAATFNHMASELEQAEQLRRDMTVDIAHELRTPLSVVRGKLEGVLDGVYPATPEHLQPILEATDLLTFLVEDLRMLAQAEAGKLVLEKEKVNVAELLQDAVINFEHQATDQGVELQLGNLSDTLQVTADWRRVNQVMGNLISNALRHTPKGGKITITAAAVKGKILITVQDTGAGIPPADLPRVFDRFWRGEKSRSRASGGIGLGLAIAKQLVNLHGGSIGVESETGNGSTFWFTLSQG